MTTTIAPTVKDHEAVSFELVESASVNSFPDVIPSKSLVSQSKYEKQNDDFKNIFICHMIFYFFLCVSLVLHIFIDLGLGSFLKNKFIHFSGLGERTVLKKSPAFAR